MSDAPFVIGVDGCPGGWVAVAHPLDAPDQATIELFATFSELLTANPSAALIAVDIPIGLPDRIGPGGRAADVAARRVLGARQSAVFAVPARGAVMCEEYRTACDAALKTSDPPRKISKQAFNLFPKIREVDALMTPELQTRVRETHPEVAFWSLNGRQPLATPKKVKSRPNPDGLAQRADLLAKAGYARAFLDQRPFRARDVGPDDQLDAAANASAAARILRGTGVCFPDQPLIDRHGLRIEIWG